MLSGEYDNYWTKTAAYESLKNYISMDFDGLKETVVQVLAGGRCKADISGFENDMTSFKRRDDVLTVLIHLGYLAYDSETAEVYIPNEEVRGAFSTVIRDTDWTPVINAVQASDALLRATWDRDADTVAMIVKLKYNKSVESAIAQIKKKQYPEALKEYQGNLLLVGISYRKKEKVYSCVIEEWEKGAL